MGVSFLGDVRIKRDAQFGRLYRIPNYMNEKQNEKPVPEPKKKRLGDYTAKELNEMPIEEHQRLFEEAFLRNLSKERPEG